MPFIEVRGLTKRFGDLVILDKLSLDINQGEIVIFQGPSGIGKSTFLRCLSCLEVFQEGSVRVGDAEIRAPFEEGRDRKAILGLRRKMGYVFQFFNLFPHLTVLENLTIGPVRVLGEPPEQAEETGRKLLQRIGLDSKANHYPGALSGGQQQRVAIARSLAMHPQAVLFDEPTASLDPDMKKEILEVIEEFRKDRLTMLIVTHEPEIVSRIASRILTFRSNFSIS